MIKWYPLLIFFSPFISSLHLLLFFSLSFDRTSSLFTIYFRVEDLPFNQFESFVATTLQLIQQHH